MRQLAKLSPRTVATLKAPGRYSDGGGLYLIVEPSGSKRWTFLFRWRRPGVPGAGRLREMGLGSIISVPIEKARKRAAAAREMVGEGIDPIAEKHAQRAVPTFGTMADELVATRSEHIDNDKSLARLKRCLEVYAAPLRAFAVDQISTDDVLRTLTAKPPKEPSGEAFWTRIPASAQMTRSYIEAVLDAARARGFRTGDNPARWRGHLDHLLSKPKKLTRGNHAAMAFADVPSFMGDIAGEWSSAAAGLRFLILTAARSGEVFGAKWGEIDLNGQVWTVPAQRMKARKLHRVPLSEPALQLLESLKLGSRNSDDFVFPGAKVGKSLSGMAFEMLLRRRAISVTVHGFRSAFRDWVGETTSFPREVAEAALAHAVGDAAERAYRRGDALEKRRDLMQAWGRYCMSDSTNVVPIERHSVNA